MASFLLIHSLWDKWKVMLWAAVEEPMGQEEAEGLNPANKHINDINDCLPD